MIQPLGPNLSSSRPLAASSNAAPAPSFPANPADNVSFTPQPNSNTSSTQPAPSPVSAPPAPQPVAAAAPIPSTLFVEPSAPAGVPLLESKGWSFDALGAVRPARGTLRAMVQALVNDQAPPNPGYLLVGDSGSGKTTLARAMAGELHAQGIPVLSATGAEFSLQKPGDDRGTGPDRVRNLFAEAARQAQQSPHKAAVVFVDDIEACTRIRAQAASDVNSQNNVLTNAFVDEACKAEQRSDCRIVLVGATGSLGSVDVAANQALPNHVNVDNPRDAGERLEMVQALDARNHYPFGEDKDELLQDFAVASRGSNALQLTQLLDSAVNHAKQRGRRQITMGDLREARLEATFGVAKPVNSSDWMFRIAASHELGHAVVRHVMAEIAREDGRPDHLPQAIDCLSFVPRGDSNASVFLKFSGNTANTFEYCMGEVSSNYGGRAAEALFGQGHVSSGPENDLYTATNMVHDMVHRRGMGQATGVRQVDINVTSDQAVQDDEKRIQDTAEHIAATHVGFYKDFIGELAGKLLQHINDDPESLSLAGDDFEQAITTWENANPERQEDARKVRDYTRRLLESLRPHLAQAWDPKTGANVPLEQLGQSAPQAFRQPS